MCVCNKNMRIYHLLPYEKRSLIKLFDSKLFIFSTLKFILILKLHFYFKNKQICSHVLEFFLGGGREGGNVDNYESRSLLVNFKGKRDTPLQLKENGAGD